MVMEGWIAKHGAGIEFPVASLVYCMLPREVLAAP